MAGEHEQEGMGRGDAVVEGVGGEMLPCVREARLVLDLGGRIAVSLSKEAKRQAMGDCGVATQFKVDRRVRDGHRIVVYTFNVSFDLDEYLDR